MSEATDATAFNSTARVETRAPSPAAAGRKRRRKTFSCLDCRQRKLKCDNVRPSCSRCQKVGRSAFCTYDSSSVSEARVDHPNATTEGVTEHGFQSGTDIAEVGTPSQTSGPPDGGHDATVQSLIQQLEAQNGRIAELEAKLSRVDIRPDSLLSRAHNTGPEGSGVRPTGDRFEMEAGSRFELEAATIKGREFETQLYGASHWMSPIINVSIAAKVSGLEADCGNSSPSCASS
jgi:Fungal Zn(2)-Cys(6) binuclear cluster domain